MPELKTRPAPGEDPVRVVERDAPHAGIQELERRVASLQNDVAQLSGIAHSVRQASEGFMRVTPPMYHGLDQFGPMAPGMVPQPPRMGPATPLFGYGVPAYNVPPEAVTMRDFSAQPAIPRAPGVNIVDAGEEVVVQVELPAIKKKDLEIHGSDRSLSITAQVRPDGETEGTVLLGEVAPTTFRRTILLPAPCNTARCKAILRDGILTLAIPKRDPSNGMRRIDVAYG